MNTLSLESIESCFLRGKILDKHAELAIHINDKEYYVKSIEPVTINDKPCIVLHTTIKKEHLFNLVSLKMTSVLANIGCTGDLLVNHNDIGLLDVIDFYFDEDRVRTILIAKDDTNERLRAV